MKSRKIQRRTTPTSANLSNILMPSETARKQHSRRIKMARGMLLNSIPDLIIEWASAHSTRSVRDFLMNEMKLSDSQYRYVIGRAPLINWATRRGEIQNSIAATKIDRLAEQAVDVHWDFIRSAKIGTAKIREGLVRLDSPEADSAALVDCLKALESCQTVFLTGDGSSRWTRTPSTILLGHRNH